MNTKVAKKKNNKGFTLIELIVVIAIIAVLAAILAPQYLRYVEKSRISSDCQAAAEILNATKTAVADPDVYDNLTSGTDDTTTTVTWADKKLTIPNTELKKEISTTLGGANLKRKSKTLGSADWVVTVKTDKGNATTTVNGTWTGGALKADQISTYNKRSGGNVGTDNSTITG